MILGRKLCLFHKLYIILMCELNNHFIGSMISAMISTIATSLSRFGTVRHSSELASA